MEHGRIEDGCQNASMDDPLVALEPLIYNGGRLYLIFVHFKMEMKAKRIIRPTCKTGGMKITFCFI